MYVNLKTLEVVSLDQLKALFPNTGFPPDVGNEALLEYGFAVLEYDEIPTLGAGETYSAGPVYLEGGHAYQTWIIVPAPAPDYLLLNTAELERLQRLANVQVTALQGRFTTLNWLINVQTPEDQAEAGEEYIEPTADDVAELAAVKTKFSKWNTYNTKLGKVKAQPTWPAAPVWPVQPEPYTSETSAVTSPTV